MLDILSYDFMQNSIIAGILASILCGIIGVFIVIKRVIFLSGGISHISFGGIGIAYYIGIEPFWGAIVFSLLSALGLGAIKDNPSNRNDTLIGILWAVGMSIGILFIYLTPGYTPDLTSYLFGNIFSVSLIDIYLSIILIIIIIIVFSLFYKEFIAIFFDKEFSLIKNIHVRLFNIIFFIITAFTIVILIEIVGIVLVLALLTIPPSISLLFTKSIRNMIFLSIIIGIFSILIGLIISTYTNIPSGPSIILPSGFVLLILSSIKKIKRN